jgi:hypothetical protein
MASGDGGGATNNLTPFGYAPTASPITIPVNGSSAQPGQVTFDNTGLQSNFPTNALPDAFNNISSLYGNLGSQAGAYYDTASTDNFLTGLGGQQQLQNIYGNATGNQNIQTQQALNASQGITSQNQSDLSGLLNNYDQSFIQQLGPQGALGQQLAGEYNNYGITPSSGAFQQGLGNTLGQLGAQNQLQLGTQLVNNGATAQQNLLGQGLGSTLGTTQQGANQAGTQQNLTTAQMQQLQTTGDLEPYTQQQNAVNQQAGIINEAANIPIDNYGSQNNINFAQGLANQNASAQNNASNNQLYAGLGSAALMAAAK